MTTKFSLIRDINGYNGFGLITSDTKYSMYLATGVEQILTIPADSAEYLMIVSPTPGISVWVAINATAVTPTGVPTLTDSEQGPVGRRVKAGDVVHFITSSAGAEVGVVLYAL